MTKTLFVDYDFFLDGAFTLIWAKEQEVAAAGGGGGLLLFTLFILVSFILLHIAQMMTASLRSKLE